jgi:hypothetical protein
VTWRCAAGCGRSGLAIPRSLPAYPGTPSFWPRLDGVNAQPTGNVLRVRHIAPKVVARRRASMRKGWGVYPKRVPPTAL